jgi:hypothetical protein
MTKEDTSWTARDPDVVILDPGLKHSRAGSRKAM